MIKTLFNTLDISSSGMGTHRTKLNVISENIANAETTRTEEGGPYRRKIVVLKSGRGKKFRKIFHENKLAMRKTSIDHQDDKDFQRIEIDKKNGVSVDEITEDPSEFKLVYDPSHPDSNENGFVEMPNVNIVQEMVDMISSTRTFEANVTAFNSTKEMIKSSLKI